MNQCAIRKNLYTDSQLSKKYGPLFVRMMRSNQLYHVGITQQFYFFLLEINNLIKYKNIKRKKKKLSSKFYNKLIN